MKITIAKIQISLHDEWGLQRKETVIFSKINWKHIIKWTKNKMIEKLYKTSGTYKIIFKHLKFMSWSSKKRGDSGAEKYTGRNKDGKLHKYGERHQLKD